MNEKFIFSFLEDTCPQWICSHCETGYVEIDTKEISSQSTASTLESMNHEAWEPEWVEKIWISMGQCNNSQCKQPYAFSGISTLKDNGGNFYDCYSIVYQVQTVYPPVLPFRIHKSCHDSVRNAILNSTSTLFTNPASSANSLRVGIECLLTSLGVKKIRLSKPDSTTGKQNRKKISLHDRIEALKDVEYHDAKEYLMAVKWIGNAGSHPQKITQKDILQAYELLKSSLDAVYDKDIIKKNKRQAEKINKKKGPIS